MRIGLACYEFKNKDIAFNLSQIERALKEASGKVDLLCFGEAFLQGFSSLCWDYCTDREVAVEQDSQPMNSVCALSQKYGVDVIFGYIERSGEYLYSSCAVIIGGKFTHNYRRISQGWKEYWRTDGHYREGETVTGFRYKGGKITLALCGDLWDVTSDKFRTDGILIWPVFVDFTLKEWEGGEEEEYAKQALLASFRVLMVNSICREESSRCLGGAFYFCNGEILAKAPYDKESILIAEV